MTQTDPTVVTATFERGLEVAGATDIGRKRPLNEDNFQIDTQLQLLLVADGMGGHHKGEVASAEAIKAIIAFLRENVVEVDPDRTLVNDYTELDSETTANLLPPAQFVNIFGAIQHANRMLYSLNKSEGCADGLGMGTTIVGLWTPRETREAMVFHIGDSRLYLYRDQLLSCLTADHVLDTQESTGTYRPSLARNVITRAIGPLPHVSVETKLHYPGSGDLILLCSDGVTSMVSDQELSLTLSKAQSSSLAAICKEIIALANHKGGKDNITVVLARYP